MQLVRPFADHHQRKDFKTYRWNPRSCGCRYRILCTGEVIMRYNGKNVGYIDNQDQINNLSKLRGKKLDQIIDKILNITCLT